MNRFLNLLVFVLAAQVSSAQYYGFNAGALTSQFSGDGFTGYQKFAFTGGINYLKPINDKGWFLALEANYIQKGARDRRNEERGDFNDYQLYMDYIEVPIALQVPYRGIYVHSALSLSYLLHFAQYNNGLAAAAPPNLRRVEAGLQLGVNFEITDKLLFNVQYQHSLLPAQKGNSSISYWFNQGAMHSIIAVRLQYYFKAPAFNWFKNSEKMDSPEDL